MNLLTRIWNLAKKPVPPKPVVKKGTFADLFTPAELDQLRKDLEKPPKGHA